MKQIMFWIMIFNMLFLQAQSTWNETIGNEVITRTFKWQYGGYIFTNQFTFNKSDYAHYKGLSKTQPYSAYATEHTTHPYLLQVAKVLDEDAKELGYTGFKLAEYLVAFVQQAIPYTKDPYNNDNDYPRYPIETLVETRGDCEDQAALLVALLNTFGFDAILVNTPGHMAAAIACGNCNGYYNYKGKRYSYIETTNSGWRIGDIPPNTHVTATLLDVPRPPQFYRGQTTIPKPRQDSDGGDAWSQRGGKKKEGESWDKSLQKTWQDNIWRNYGGGNAKTPETTNATTTVTINGITYQFNGSGTVTINNGQVTITTY